jgi:hypothetical protein
MEETIKRLIADPGKEKPEKRRVRNSKRAFLVQIGSA